MVYYDALWRLACSDCRVILKKRVEVRDYQMVEWWECPKCGGAVQSKGPKRSRLDLVMSES